MYILLSVVDTRRSRRIRRPKRSYVLFYYSIDAVKPLLKLRAVRASFTRTAFAHFRLSPRFSSAIAYDTVHMLNCFLRREAKKGQGMKSLAGFGAAPQAGFRAAALTDPFTCCRSRKHFRYRIVRDIEKRAASFPPRAMNRIRQAAPASAQTRACPPRAPRSPGRTTRQTPDPPPSFPDAHPGKPRTSARPDQSASCRQNPARAA